MAENAKSKNGIGRIVWPLLLASLLLAMWIAYWYFLYDGSTVAVDAPAIEASAGETADGETALVSDSEAASDEPSENDSGDDSGDGSSANANADADTDSDGATADTDVADDDSADASVGADSETSTDGADEGDGETGGGETGGGETGDADADSSDENAADGTEPSASADSFAIALNSTLIVADAVAETEDNGLRLYATASLDAPTREVYPAGEAFRLVEPGEDFDAYPVEVAGISWVRVRDENGLLGWADLSLLASE